MEEKFQRIRTILANGPIPIPTKRGKFYIIRIDSNNDIITNSGSTNNKKHKAKYFHKLFEDQQFVGDINNMLHTRDSRYYDVARINLIFNHLMTL